jgi:hypothetical protein
MRVVLREKCLIDGQLWFYELFSVPVEVISHAPEQECVPQASGIYILAFYVALLAHSSIPTIVFRIHSRNGNGEREPRRKRGRHNNSQLQVQNFPIARTIQRPAAIDWAVVPPWNKLKEGKTQHRSSSACI